MNKLKHIEDEINYFLKIEKEFKKNWVSNYNSIEFFEFASESGILSKSIKHNLPSLTNHLFKSELINVIINDNKALQEAIIKNNTDYISQIIHHKTYIKMSLSVEVDFLYLCDDKKSLNSFKYLFNSDHTTLNKYNGFFLKTLFRNKCNDYLFFLFSIPKERKYIESFYPKISTYIKTKLIKNNVDKF